MTDSLRIYGSNLFFCRKTTKRKFARLLSIKDSYPELRQLKMFFVKIRTKVLNMNISLIFLKYSKS